MRTVKRVLVVEGEPIEATTRKAAIEALGFQVTGVATTEKDAIREIEMNPPDLVLMDVNLRGPADGIHTTDVITARFHVPVVFVTSDSDKATMERAIETHPYGLIVRPYSASTLLATLQLAIQRHQDEATLRQLHAEKEARLEQRNVELGALAGQLHQESIHDILTGLYNRRHLDRVLARELSLAKREKRDVGVILLDLDHFKSFNDRFGHAAGDTVLRALGAFLRSRLRAHDVACRYGGEEIVIVLSGSGVFEASQLAEQLRLGIEQLRLEHAGVPLPHITATFGVASYVQNGADPDALLRAADTALYAAKARGRNSVSVAPPS